MYNDTIYLYMYHPWQRANALLYGLDTGMTGHSIHSKGH